MADGGLTIVNQQVQGTNSGGDSGDIRTAETYSSDQSSQVQLTSTQLTGNQWVGPAVRAQAGGADVYVGIYFANFGSPELMLFLRNNSAWAQLGASVPVSALVAGTTLSLSVTGSTLTFADNGTTAITATDTTLTGGAPGIMANGLATATNWSGTGVATTTTTTTTAPTTTTTAPTTTTTTAPTTTTTTAPTTTTTAPTTTTTAPTTTTTTLPSTTTTTVPATTTTTSGGGGSGSGPSDNFARANGSLGPNWTNMADGGLTIVNQQVQGTNSGGDSGDIRTAETYSSDQSSQVQLTSTQLTGNQWVGPAVRAQAGGANVYVGIYFANFGSPELMLFLRNNGAWAQLGASVPVSALAAGTTLSLSVTGSTLTFADNGTTAITATDTTLTGGAPGIMANGLATATNWSGTGVTTTTTTTTTAATTTTTAPTTTSTIPTSSTTTTAPTSTTTSTVPSTTTTTGGGGSGGGSIPGFSGTTIATDNFARANGSLGPNWTDMADGGLTIVNQQVQGTNSGGDSGDIRTGESYTSDQFSQVQLTSTQLTGSQWVGPAVRTQAGGQDMYVGIYSWNSGSPEIMLFLRDNGSWDQLATATTTALAAGSTLTLTVVGSTLAFAVNNATVLSTTDTTLTGGAPGVVANGLASATNWSGGNSGFQVEYQGTASGIQTYDFLSPDDGYGIQNLRVLQPTHPAAGVAHNFLFVLPVEARRRQYIR